MCVHGVRSRVMTEGVSRAESAKDKPSPGIAEPQPEDVRNASIKAGDRATFVSLELEKQEESNKRALT